MDSTCSNALSVESNPSSYLSEETRSLWQLKPLLSTRANPGWN
jgi:hypothetical protein